MDLTIVGCSGSFPGPDSAASCYLVDCRRVPAAARSRQRRARRAAAAMPTRPDRRCAASATCMPTTAWTCARTTSSAPTIRLGRCRRSRSTARRARRAGSTARSGSDAAPDGRGVRLRAAGPGTMQIGPFTVTAAHMNHPVETFGFRLEHGGQVIAYSADTGPTEHAGRPGRRRRRAALRGLFPRRPRPARRPAPDRAPGRRARGAGRRRPAGAHSPGAVDTRRERSLAEAAASFHGDIAARRTGNGHSERGRVPAGSRLAPQ